MTAPTTTSGLLGLVRGVREYFRQQSFSAKVVVSWTGRNRQDNQGPGGGDRVVFIPGKFDPSTGVPKVLPAGTLSRMGAQNHVNLDPRMRALAWALEFVTVSVWGVDHDDPNDEEGQIEATQALLERTLQGIHNAVDPETQTAAGFGNIEEFGDMFWTLPPGERAFGRELTFGFSLLVPYFDVGVDLAFPGPGITRGRNLPE